MNTNRSLRMARRLAGAALLGGFLASAPGCGHSGIVGTWQGKVPFGTMTLPMAIEFKSDGTDTRTIQALTGTAVLSDTYVVKDGNLRITPTGMMVNGKSHSVPSLLSAPQDFSMKVSGDTLSLTPPDQSVPFTLTRVKSQ